MPPLKIVAKKIPQLADFCTATLAGFYSAVDISSRKSNFSSRKSNFSSQNC